MTTLYISLCVTHTVVIFLPLCVRIYTVVIFLPVCIYIRIQHGRTKKPSATAEGGGDDTASLSSVVTTQSVDEGASSSRHALHKAVLEIVYSLSSDVSLKKNSQGLNQ